MALVRKYGNQCGNMLKSLLSRMGKVIHFHLLLEKTAPTCLQPITEPAAKQLQKFNDYLKDKTQSEADVAKKNFDQAVKNLRKLNFDLTAHEGVLSWIDGSKKRSCG